MYKIKANHSSRHRQKFHKVGGPVLVALYNHPRDTIITITTNYYSVIFLIQYGIFTEIFNIERNSKNTYIFIGIKAKTSIFNAY